MREHNYGNAQDLYRDIVAKNPNSTDAWRGLLVVLHQQHADKTLVVEIPRIPAAVRTQLEADPSFLILEASAYVIAGQPQGALPLLQTARSRYTAQHRNPPADLDIQLAWTMLAVSDDQPGLSDLFTSDQKRTDLTAKQREAFQELYSTWSVRRAEHAFETKPELAYSILTDAGRQYPSDRNIHATLASLYLKRREKQKALDVFQSWGMTNAQAGDYRVATGAALSSHKTDLAEDFLRQGREHFPRDPELMHMTARFDIARGDYDAGERELRSALVAVREQGSADPQMKTPPLPNVQQDGGTSLANHRGPTQVANSQQSAPPCKSRTDTAGNARIRPISLEFTLSHDQSPAGQQDAGQTTGTQTQAPGASAQAQKPAQNADQDQHEQEMQDEVEAVENRNTPFITTGGTGTGRLGDSGFDRLIIADSLLGGAYTASNRVRFGVEGHGVFANAGTPDGSSDMLFGTLPAGALFGEQSKVGYSGIAQLSTKTFGIMGGTSPQGFAVHNLIGGVRYRPGDKWFTLLAVRDSVKDSLLSYAGSHDPGTGMRWGGVVANTGTAMFNSAPSSNLHYKVIGEYASVSYSFITGLNVPDNWSMSGNGGLYWQMVQGLTLGVNVTGMHYDKNLNYFSFGHGGYFSPQQYYLASIPITWYSRKQRFEYQVKFSGGVQHLQQDATPFYPVSPGSAAVKSGFYAGTSDTTPNYDADIRIGYRVAPHVYLDAFATANNARDYYTQSAGFNLRFMINRIPTNTDLRVNSIPDWMGKQPYAIR
jgi:hypothetical protein